MGLTARDRLALAGVTSSTYVHAAHVVAAVPALVVTSGLRSIERNRFVGGVPNSLHLSGRAVDFAGSSVALAAGYAYACRFGPPGSASGPTEALIHDSGSGRHLHLAW
jgi:uncharacterized protein YcbK (DUF882 family)